MSDLSVVVKIPKNQVIPVIARQSSLGTRLLFPGDGIRVSLIYVQTEHSFAATVFFDYSKLVARTAKELGIDFLDKGVVVKPVIREVLFLDTANFRLYNNAFILRRRIRYQDGFPIDDPEIVFKFRHPDMQKAAELDVRPNIAGNYRIKFKAEALPLKDQMGGYRMLFSHNAATVADSCASRPGVLM
jgi:hypothetical protein